RNAGPHQGPYRSPGARSRFPARGAGDAGDWPRIRIWRGLRTAFGRGRGGIGERGHAVMRSTGNCAGIPIFAKQIPEAQADRRLTVASGAREISVAGITLIADLAGALYWPEQRLLVVSDLHLEKGSSLASRGVLLPPYDTASTLERLAD